MKPTPGEEFVWMEADPDAYDETMQRIVEVCEEVVPGVWLIGYREGPAGSVVNDFMKKLGIFNEKMLQTHRLLCRVTRGDDGRWHAVRPHFDDEEE